MSFGKRADPARTEPRLVTRSTILILSGWLIGAATTNWMPAEIEQFVTLVGLLGLIAFAGLDTNRKPG
jgi:hypothetical protein